MAGYSSTPLLKKLGIKPGMRVCIVNAPERMPAELTALADVELVAKRANQIDCAVAFCPNHSALRKHFSALAKRIKPAGMLWVGWFKKSSGVATDLTEDMVRSHGLEVGLVDTKVCAIDDMWSGLKFVHRLKDRPKRARGTRTIGPSSRRA